MELDSFSPFIEEEFTIDVGDFNQGV